jgi:hypothetical protein
MCLKRSPQVVVSHGRKPYPASVGDMHASGPIFVHSAHARRAVSFHPSEYIGAVSGDWRVDRVDEIRSLIKQAEPDVVEEIKWRKPSNPDGVPAFSLDGLICTLEMYKGKVKVNFAKGSSVKDPDHLFNASLEAPVGRSIDLREDDELDVDAFKALIQEAVRVNRK